MKNKIIILFLFAFVFVENNQAQDNSNEIAFNAKDYFRVNVAIPDMPAFKILGTDPSDILRPTSIPEFFSLVSSEFYDNSQFTIPKSFALELTPGILITNFDNLTLEKIRNRNWFTTSKVSIGTLVDQNGFFNAAIGYRVTILDKQSIWNDRDQIDYLQQKVKKETVLYNYYVEKTYTPEEHLAFLKNPKNGGTDSLLRASNQYYKENPKKVDEVFLSVTSFKSKEIDATINTSNAKDSAKTHWNKAKIELSVALYGVSPDSLVRNIKYGGSAMWFSMGLPLLGKDKKNSNYGQLLVGANLQHDKGKLDNADFLDFSLGSRLYVGINAIKGFVEAQYKLSNNLNTKFIEHKGLFDIGCEVSVTSGIWLDLFVGAEVINGATNFTGNLNIKWKLFESKAKT